jgi:hypothetical protein
MIALLWTLNRLVDGTQATNPREKGNFTQVPAYQLPKANPTHGVRGRAGP